jgi:hypothetical protein
MSDPTVLAPATATGKRQNNTQWIRRVSLLLQGGDKGLELGAFRIRFQTQNTDTESPNNCSIRVYNLADKTIAQITGKGEFTGVVLNAGYEGGNYGVIFQGSIKQFRVGRENAKDSYLDIFAADGDIGYNQGIVRASLAKGTTAYTAMQTAAGAMPGIADMDTGALKIDKQHIPSIRGTVLFGMARARLRNLTSNLDASWSIQDGKVVVTANEGYQEGTAVKINVATGLIGLPEQTGEGIKIQCLLNSRIRIGALVQLNNSEIVQTMQRDSNAAPIAYNQWAAFQNIAPLSADGVYRAFVVEHEGDSRGHNWYTNIIGLAVDMTVPADKGVIPQ